MKNVTPVLTIDIDASSSRDASTKPYSQRLLTTALDFDTTREMCGHKLRRRRRREAKNKWTLIV